MAYIYSAIIGLFLAASLLLWEARPQGTGSSEAAEPVIIAPIGVLQSAPSLSAAQIDGILAGYGSPAQGEGKSFYQLGIAYGIDPAYALAFFVEESGAGTNPKWDGLKPDGTTTHDIGNISCAGYPTCYGRWRDYPTWEAGIEDWYRLIAVEYIEGRGHTTVDDVIPVYAPSFENDVGGYTNTVNALVGKWREETQDGGNNTVSLPQAFATSQPYLLQGDIGTNVRAALNANDGALQAFEIKPGETWSFGRSIKPIAALGYLPVVCGPAGCNPGGGWCDLSALYVKVADQLGLESHFPAHVGVSDTRFPGILLNDGDDSGDLTIYNPTSSPVRFRAFEQDGLLVVEGGN